MFFIVVVVIIISFLAHFYTIFITGDLFTRIRVTPSLHRSKGIFLVFLMISSLVWSRWSQQWCCQDGFPFFLWSPIPPVIFHYLWGLFQVHYLELVSQSLSCSTTFFRSFARSIYWPVLSLSFVFTSWSLSLLSLILLLLFRCRCCGILFFVIFNRFYCCSRQHVFAFSLTYFQQLFCEIVKDESGFWTPV